MEESSGGGEGGGGYSGGCRAAASRGGGQISRRHTPVNAPPGSPPSTTHPSVNQPTPPPFGHTGQTPPKPPTRDHVADGVDRRHLGPEVVVHLDAAALVGGDADVVEAQLLGEGAAACFVSGGIWGGVGENLVAASVSLCACAAARRRAPFDGLGVTRSRRATTNRTSTHPAPTRADEDDVDRHRLLGAALGRLEVQDDLVALAARAVDLWLWVGMM